MPTFDFVDNHKRLEACFRGASGPRWRSIRTAWLAALRGTPLALAGERLAARSWRALSGNEAGRRGPPTPLQRKDKTYQAS